jgi:hypothetical protein
MDVFHKVLTRIFKEAGGKETVKVDMGEILKQEGFFPSRDEISSHMVKEGWVTEAGHQYSVYITHWGVAEAKKTLKNVPDNSRALEKETRQLIASAKEFVVVAEEFAGNPTKAGLKLVEKHFDGLGTVTGRIKSALD